MYASLTSIVLLSNMRINLIWTDLGKLSLEDRRIGMIEILIKVPFVVWNFQQMFCEWCSLNNHFIINSILQLKNACKLAYQTTRALVLIQILVYIQDCFFHYIDFQIVPLHILMLATNTWRSLENLDLHCSGMMWSLTLELATDMLYNHDINSLPTMISPTTMRSPSITEVEIKYEKLSSAVGKTGMTMTLNKFGTLNWYFLIIVFIFLAFLNNLSTM